MGLFWTIGNSNYGREARGRLFELGNNWEQQLRARSGRLLEFVINWEQQLRARAAAFLKAKYWVSFGQLETTTRAAKRPLSENGQQLGTTTTAAKRLPF